MIFRVLASHGDEIDVKALLLVHRKWEVRAGELGGDGVSAPTSSSFDHLELHCGTIQISAFLPELLLLVYGQ